MAPDVAKDRGPVDPVLGREVIHRDTSAVVDDELSDLVRSEVPLDREGGDEQVGRIDGRPVRALPQHGSERWQPQYWTIHLGNRVKPCR